MLIAQYYARYWNQSQEDKRNAASCPYYHPPPGLSLSSVKLRELELPPGNLYLLM